MTTQTNAFQSRWGYHPCSYDLFLKLKYLHKWYWQTVFDFHRWHRWKRKDMQNRKGPEPAYSEVFIEDIIWYKPVKYHGIDGCKVYPKRVVDQGIVELYRSARMPQSEPVEPFDDETAKRIETLYQKVKMDRSAAGC